MANTFYPFTLYASDRHGGVAGGFHSHWMKIKPKELIWYAVHVRVLNSTEIEFCVHDMADPVHGGIGRKIREFRDRCTDSATLECRVQRATYLAEEKRARELCDAESQIVAGYADEFLKMS